MYPFLLLVRNRYIKKAYEKKGIVNLDKGILVQNEDLRNPVVMRLPDITMLVFAMIFVFLFLTCYLLQPASY
jgi:hypothetical protein